jgi:hydrogenase maturation factor
VSPATPAECRGPTCITCSDQATEAEVIRPPAAPWEDALVKVPGGVEAVDVSLVGEVAAGDLVLIHAGAAIGRVAAGAASDPQPRSERQRPAEQRAPQRPTEQRASQP